MKMWQYKTRSDLRQSGNKGASAIEFAIILPILVMLVFAAIDFGRLFHARLILTNLAREGANLASREINLPAGTYSAANLIALLQSGARPLDMAANGKIYVWKIVAGKNSNADLPTLDLNNSADGGSLNIASTITNDHNSWLGLNKALYDHLVFDDSENQKTADIAEVTVVEVFYQYTPITPVLMTSQILSSRAIF